MQGQYSFLQQDPRFLQQQQANAQRQPGGGQLQPQQTGYVQSQPTGYMQPQQTGYVQPQQTGFVQAQQTGFVPPQQTGYMQQQRTGFVQPQMTGFASGGMMRPQQTGFGMAGPGMSNVPAMPALPSQFQGLQQQIIGTTGSSPATPSGYMTHSSQIGPMAAQPTGYGMGFRGQMPAIGASSQPFLSTFMPAPGAQQPIGFGGSSFQPSQMQFAQQPNQFSGMTLQQTFQHQNQQQIGNAAVKVPWKLSSDEKKSYDQIFRAWDQSGTGFLEGKMATEVFAQSALAREDLMQIWGLADVENRGKLNLAEFHVAMGLIYRRLNGNPIPATLPTEMVPPSARDLDNSVDFLKDLLKKDNARSTGESYGQHTLGPVRSLHGNRSSPNLHKDATMYKHDEVEASNTYKSRSRHIDRSSVRRPGEKTNDVDDVRRELDRSDSMLESSRHRDDDDDSLDQELEDVKYQIRRIQDDIEHISRSGRRSEAKDNERRKLERDLLRLRHEELPRLEVKIEDRDRERLREANRYSRERDARNNRGRFASDDGARDEDDYRRRDSYPDRGYLKGTYDRDDAPSRTSERGRDMPSRSSYRDAPSRASARENRSERGEERELNHRREDSSHARSPSSPTVAKSPPPRPVSSAAASSVKRMTPEEKKAFIQAEAQRRIQERLRSLGINSGSSSPTVDSSVSSRLEQEKREAERLASEADKESEEREKQRQIRLEEERLGRLRADEELNAKATKAVKEAKEEVADLPASKQPVQNDLLAEEEEFLRKREEALAKEKAARLARIKQLEEEEEESRRLEEEFKKKKAMFTSQQQPSNLGPVVSKKVAPPPPAPRVNKPPPPLVPGPRVSIAQSTSVPPAPQLVALENQTSAPTLVIQSDSSTSPSSALSSSRSLDSAPPPPAPSAPPAPPTPNSATTPSLSTNNPFHRMNSSASDSIAAGAPPSSFSRSLSANNPFLKPNASGSSPATTVQSSATPVSRPSFRPPPRVADSDDEWDAAKEKDDDDDDSDEEGATTARQARQGLAEALFGGMTPSRPHSAAGNMSGSSAPTTGDVPQPPAPPPAPPSAPAAPPAPSSIISPPSGAPPSRGMLLGEIQSGTRLRKTQTSDRSTSSIAGKVIGSASPPRRSIEASSSSSSEVEDNSYKSGGLNNNDHRRSVDWIGGMAAHGMRSVEGGHQPTLESHAEEPVGQQFMSPIVGDGDDVKSGFDLTRVVRVRALYSYEAQRPEDLSLDENLVISAHHSIGDGDWMYGTLESDQSQSGTFPRSYVEEVRVRWGTALYEYTASGPEEVSLIEGGKVAVMDWSDPDWFKVEEGGRVGLAPGAYIELSSEED